MNYQKGVWGLRPQEGAAALHPQIIFDLIKLNYLAK
jgi:hypothetical protein